MSRMIEVPEGVFARLQGAAAAEGLAPGSWLDARLRSSENGQHPCAAPRTLADLFVGRMGRFSSGTGEPRLETLRESFGEYLEEKHRSGHL
jgi:hypothetical protein